MTSWKIVSPGDRKVVLNPFFYSSSILAGEPEDIFVSFYFLLDYVIFYCDIVYIKNNE